MSGAGARRGTAELRSRHVAGEGASLCCGCRVGAWGGPGRPAGCGRQASHLANVESRIAHQGQYSWWRKGVPRRSQLPDSQAERDRVPARGGRSLRRATCRPAEGSTRSWAPCSILGPRDHGKQSRGAGDGVTACWRRRPRFSRTEPSLHVTHRFRDTKRFCRKLTRVNRNYKRCNDEVERATVFEARRAWVPHREPPLARRVRPPGRARLDPGVEGAALVQVSAHIALSPWGASPDGAWRLPGT